MLEQGQFILAKWGLRVGGGAGARLEGAFCSEYRIAIEGRIDRVLENEMGAFEIG